MKERDIIRDKYFNLQELRIPNDDIFRPKISFDPLAVPSEEIISIFENQIPWEYSTLVNEEIFKLEVQFLQFIHYYQNAQMDTHNICMYRPLLNMSAESGDLYGHCLCLHTRGKEGKRRKKTDGY